MLAFTSDCPDWETDGAIWPNRDTSRFVEAGHMRWHIQEMGLHSGPSVLLLHGTGSASHSFGDLMPLLAQHYRVLSIDLPGHGFTSGARSSDLTLPGMAQALAHLLASLDFRADYAVGHSAGAAILIQMAMHEDFAPSRIFAINGALEPIEGNAILSPIAKLMFLNPLTPRMVAMQARAGNLAPRLLKAAGSTISDEMKACYAMLIAHASHVRGALGMMANWDLQPLRDAFVFLKTPVTLIASADDTMVTASVSRRAARLMPAADYVEVPSGGHLLHEAEPDTVAAMLLERMEAAS